VIDNFRYLHIETCAIIRTGPVPYFDYVAALGVSIEVILAHCGSPLDLFLSLESVVKGSSQ
jgi:hypothetical protein